MTSDGCRGLNLRLFFVLASSEKRNVMKTFLFVLALFLTLGLSAQPKPRPLTPARGHYQQLEKFSPKAKSAGLAVDAEKFPFDAASAERRLSLKPYYLQGKKVDDFKIPEPPANSSDQTRAELNYLLGLQNQRTKLDEESSLFMAGVYYNPRTTPADSNYHTYRKNLFYIGRSIGTWFNPDSLPKTADLMARAWQDASYFIWAFKYKHLRVRPYVLEPELNNLEETNWAAYPSGHAANSYVNAFIYQELAPQFSDVFMKDAYDMAHSREIIGVHYPSDSESSRILARQIVNKLLENPAFQRDFAAARQEWKSQARESFARPAPAATDADKKGSSCAKTCN